MQLTTDTVAVVTGGGSGIGLANADRFARSGCKVVLADVLPTASIHSRSSCPAYRRARR